MTVCAAPWSLVGHLAAADPDLIALARTPDGRAWALTPPAAEARRLLTVDDPLLFAWVYMRRHLTSPETGGVSFSAFHVDLADSAVQWARHDLGPAELREAWVAPRGSGKSTWLFGILPTWALAHGHRRFVAAFADSGGQAQQHLSSLKRELDTNTLLRHDYPALCRPAQRPGGASVADNQALYVAESGAVFMAKGIDASTLGAKVGNTRPDVLLFDDIEPDASNYSPHQKAKRQDTIVNAVFPMNLNAVVLFAGTTTMHGSIVHDIVRQDTEPDDAPAWVRDENIRTRYYPAIVTAADGAERSLWPERWSLDFLNSIRHTRSYAMNYDNQPRSLDGDFWSEDDFHRRELPAVTRRLLSIDPATTSRASSDYTGLAVVAYDPVAAACQVEHAEQVKLPPAALRAKVLDLLAVHDVRHVLIEVNQGGDAWAEILAPLPAKVVTIHQTERKEVRAARVLDLYQQGRVMHPRRLAALEAQMCAFPAAAHDDLVDAAGSGVWLFLKDVKRPAPPRTRTHAYV